MKNHKCKDCAWWDDRHPFVETVPHKLCKKLPGICRKHKPGVVSINNYHYGIQPVTDAHDFCGEFRKDGE